MNWGANNLTGSSNLVTSGTSMEGSFTGDPMFVDAENGDFHLFNGSDCIDQRIDMSLAYNFDNEAITKDGEPDIRPYEYK
jgi:hypothetical protein